MTKEDTLRSDELARLLRSAAPPVAFGERAEADLAHILASRPEDISPVAQLRARRGPLLLVVLTILGIALIVIVGTAWLAMAPVESTRWEPHAVVQAHLDSALPSSVNELAAQADIVVLGTIKTMSEATPRQLGQGIVLETVRVTLSAERISGPVTDETLAVEWPLAGELLSPPPRQTYLFFLDRVPGEDAYSCAVAGLCVLGIEEGHLTSPRQPGLAAQLGTNNGVESLEELFGLIANR